MASGVRVKIHMSGVKRVFADAAVQGDLMRRGQAIADMATSLVEGYGYPAYEHHEAKEGHTRYGNHSVLVVCATNEAKACQARHSTLTKAMDAGR